MPKVSRNWKGKGEGISGIDKALVWLAVFNAPLARSDPLKCKREMPFGVRSHLPKTSAVIDLSCSPSCSDLILRSLTQRPLNSFVP
jgi:hypothetical protein